MISKTNVLAVSLIAFMSIYGARAEIASKAYVDSAIPTQVKANWNEADSTSAAYIQNKPTLGTAAAAAATDFAAASHNQASNTINAMTGYVKADTATAIDASTDTLNTAIGKLEKALDGKQASGSYAPALASQITAGATNSVVTYNADGLVTGGTAAGALATLSAVGSTEITDGSIMNADINASAAIAQSKIDGLATALANAQNKIPSGSEGSSTLASIWVQ